MDRRGGKATAVRPFRRKTSRVFGTKLSVNSPLPSQKKQQQLKPVLKSLQQKQLLQSGKRKKKKDETQILPPNSGFKTAAGTGTTVVDGNSGGQSDNGMGFDYHATLSMFDHRDKNSSAALATPCQGIAQGSNDQQQNQQQEGQEVGMNLMTNFNSPSNNKIGNHKTDDAWTKFTPDNSWDNNRSSGSGARIVPTSSTPYRSLFPSSPLSKVFEEAMSSSTQREASLVEHVRRLEEKVSSITDNLQSEVESLKMERYQTLKNMIDVQSQFEDANAKVKELESTVDKTKHESNRSREASIAMKSKLEDSTARVKELEQLVDESNNKSKLSQEASIAMQSQLEDATARVKELEWLVKESKDEFKRSEEASFEMVVKLEGDVERMQEQLDEKEQLIQEKNVLSSMQQGEVSTLMADLAKAKEDAKVTSKAFEEVMSSFNQRDASLVEQVRSLEETVSALTDDLAEAQNDAAVKSKALDEERLNSNQREVSLVEQIESLEADLTRAKDDADAKSKTFEEERLSFNKRDASHMENANSLEEKISSLTLDLANAREDADLKSKVFEEERAGFSERDASNVEKLRILEKSLEDERQKAVEGSKDQAAIVARLEERIAVVESDRDDARLELDKERLSMSALADDLARAKEGAAMSSKELEEERMIFSERAASQLERFDCLEHRLEDEKRKAIESTNDHLPIMAQRDARIAVVEAERDDTHLELENERSALSSLKLEQDELQSNLEEIKADIARLEAEKEVAVAKIESLSADLDASNSENDNLESQLEVSTSKYNSIESKHRECLDELKNTTIEKTKILSDLFDVKAKFGITIANLDASIKGKSNEVDSLNEIITSFNAQISQLTAQLGILEQERDELAKKVEEAAQRDAIRAEQVCNLEKSLEDQKLKADERSEDHLAIISTLEERIATALSDQDNLHQEREKDRSMFEEERTTFNERDAIRADQVHSIEKQLEDEKRNFLESTEDQVAIVAQLEECMAVAESDRNDTRLELEKKQSALFAVTAQVAQIKKDADESSKAFEDERSILIEQICSLKARLQDEMRAKDQAAAVARLEERISVTESKRDAMSLELKKERSALSALRDNLAKSKEDADVASKAFEEERLRSSQREVFLLEHSQSLEADMAKVNAEALTTSKSLEEERFNYSQRDASHVEQVRLLEERRQDDYQQALEIVRDQAAIVTELEERIAVVELDRDDARLELDKERLTMSALADDLARAKEGAAMSSKELEEERMIFSEYAAYGVERVHRLEDRLEAEKRKAMDTTNDHLDSIAQWKALIAVVGAERDDTHLELENERSALSSLKLEHDELQSNLEEIKVEIALLDAEKEVAVAKIESLSADLNASKSNSDDLESQIEIATAKYNSNESKHRECLDKLERVTVEKLKVSSELSVVQTKCEGLIADLEALTSQIEVATSKYVSIESKYRECLDEFESTTGEKTKILSQLSDDKAKYETTINTLEARLQDKIIEVDSLNEEIKSYNAQVGTLTQERDELAIKVEEVVLNFAKSEADAKQKKLSFSELDANRLAHVLSLQKSREDQKEKTGECSAEKTAIIARLEEHLALALSDRDHLRQEREKDQSTLTALTTDLGKAKEDADLISKTLEEERLSFSQRDASHSGQVFNLEERLAEEEQKGKSLEAERMILKGRIKVLENEGESHQIDICKLKATVKSLETERAGLIGRIQMFELHIESMGMENVSMAATRDDLQLKIQSIEAELKVKAGEAHELTNQLHLTSESQISSDIKHDAELRELLRKVETSQADAFQSKALSDDLISEKKSREAKIHSLGKRARELASDLESQASFQSKHEYVVKKLLKKLKVSRNEARQNKALSDELKSKLESAEALVGTANAEIHHLSQKQKVVEPSKDQYVSERSASATKESETQSSSASELIAMQMALVGDITFIVGDIY